MLQTILSQSHRVKKVKEKTSLNTDESIIENTRALTLKGALFYSTKKLFEAYTWRVRIRTIVKKSRKLINS